MFGFAAVGLILVGIITRGWALSTLWEWFLVPLGVVAIGINTAIGISVLVGLFTQHLSTETVKLNDKTKTPADLMATIVMKSIGGPLVALFIGWIVILFA